MKSLRKQRKRIFDKFCTAQGACQKCSSAAWDECKPLVLSKAGCRLRSANYCSNRACSHYQKPLPLRAPVCPACGQPNRYTVQCLLCRGDATQRARASHAKEHGMKVTYWLKQLVLQMMGLMPPEGPVCKQHGCTQLARPGHQHNDLDPLAEFEGRMRRIRYQDGTAADKEKAWTEFFADAGATPQQARRYSKYLTALHAALARGDGAAVARLQANSPFPKETK